jgi:hypothetical protein
MRKTYLPAVLILAAATAGVAGCANRTGEASVASNASYSSSTVPNRQCNPALVVNPRFLQPNEGVAGAGGPDLPGLGAASEPNCPAF